VRCLLKIYPFVLDLGTRHISLMKLHKRDSIY